MVCGGVEVQDFWSRLGVIGQRDTVKWDPLLLPAPCHARKMLSRNFLEAGVANLRVTRKLRT